MSTAVLSMSKHRTRGPRCGVEGCTRPAPAGALCGAHVEQVTEALNDLPALAHALDARYLRQQRFSVASLHERKPDESSVPFDEQAGRLRRELSRFLLHWVTSVPHRAGRLRNTAESETAYLVGSMTWLAGHPEFAEELIGLHGRIVAAVDRPPDLVYLGVCSAVRDGQECPEDLYAEWGAPVAKCRACGRQHDVRQRRDVLLAAIADQLAAATDIARGLSGLDMNVTAERIRQWKARGRIIERGPNYQGQPLFRVGDVLDLLVTDNRKRNAK